MILGRLARRARHGRVALALVVPLIVPATAEAFAKAIWGPATAFPVYHELHVGIYETGLSWAGVAPTRPRHPGNPNDPAYHWPADLDAAVAQASRYRIRVMVEIADSPAWANGGHRAIWAPRNPADYATFTAAAARRYPSVHLWMIWGEPSNSKDFMPEVPETIGRPLDARQARAPHLYARILDAAYGALKRVDRRNLVIGGDSWTDGSVSPLNWIRNLRLPNGRPPRMDLYGHNPFTIRPPSFGARPLGYGDADFSDLPLLAKWLDRYLSPHHRLRLFLAEFTLPTTHQNYEFNFYVTRAIQAKWLGLALRLSRHWSRIYAFGWLSLDDEAANSSRTEVDYGLIDQHGKRKPAFYAYQRG